jgi:hypothetical protein
MAELNLSARRLLYKENYCHQHRVAARKGSAKDVNGGGGGSDDDGSSSGDDGGGSGSGSVSGKGEPHPSLYFRDARSQATAEYYARLFNMALSEATARGDAERGHQVHFVPVAVIEVERLLDAGLWIYDVDFSFCFILF